jgi:predicted nucleic acid-binding protein
VFNFNFGKKKPDIKYAIIAVTLSVITATLSQCTGISQNNLWDILDEIQRKYFPQTILNEFIIQDDEKLKRRIDRDVNRAIDDITPEYNRIISDDDKKYQPRYFEKPVDTSVCYTDECKALGGEMRICAPWVDSCPKE